MSAPIATDVSDAGLNFIAHFEGCVLKPYNDAASGGGNATIGIGHLIHTGPVTHADELEYANFTQQDALDLLHKDAEHAVAGVKSLDHSFLPHEFDALVSFAFNCGVGSLMGGIAKNLNAGNKPAAMATLEEYVHAGSTVLEGLVVRRHAEAALFLQGIYLPPAA